MITTLLEERGFLEDNYHINLKIVFGIGCSTIALLSQFWKNYEEEKLLDHPEWQLFCVITYASFMALYYYVDYYMVKDSFFVCNGHPVSFVFQSSIFTLTKHFPVNLAQINSKHSKNKIQLSYG